VFWVAGAPAVCVSLIALPLVDADRRTFREKGERNGFLSPWRVQP